ncbi:unnamed protein product [Mytilus coruscus]|uniref:Uncharacterized protein n=1 Tax=Mytilus coruscus TaxID=42192 RepID=A0A6J8B7L6_MYTCO|nr:unnamed protein product [Mytilus coruscus]
MLMCLSDDPHGRKDHNIYYIRIRANDINNIHENVLKIKGLQEQGVKGLNTEELNRQLGNQLQNLLDNNDLAKGKSRCQQLEARSFELEQTVKLLKRRIESDSHLAMPVTPNTCEAPISSQDVYHKMKQELDRKLANLHTKLSNIVLDEMDRQLDKIKLFDGNQLAATESPKTDSKRIQCIEIKENSNSNILLTSVYLPAKGSKNHLSIRIPRRIDQLYELYQKYSETHNIIKGVTNEDLNEQTGTKRNLYLLRDFINECGLKYDNKANTFVNSLGQESPEIDYFLHNLADQDFQAKQVLNELIENTSDHHPIQVKHKQNNSRIKKKVNWDKVDKQCYSAYIDTHIDNLQINENMEETAVEEAILKLCELLRETADLTSSSKAIFNAKPKIESIDTRNPISTKNSEEKIMGNPTTKIIKCLWRKSNLKRTSDVQYDLS